MKNIELTEEHKSKLLEMCKKLFPKSKIQFINDFYCEWSLFLITEDDYDSTLPKDKVECHWFEFCMTHLIVQLSKEFTKQKLSKSDYTSNQYPNWFSKKVSYHLNPFRNEEFEEDIIFIHPVDYLYEEFKKLK